MHHGGFINIIVILVAVILIGTIGYVLFSSKSPEQPLDLSVLSELETKEMVQRSTGYWTNPAISCSLNERETPIKQYPYESGLTDEERNDPPGFVEFCLRMESRFENSEVQLSEANEIYTAILDENIIRNEPYGMPSPDAPPVPELTLENIKESVKIKKISEGTYEIFYKHTTCGTNYEHESIDVQGGQISQRERIEAWSGSYPC